MIQGVLDSIVEWLKEILIDCIMNNLTGMFDQINTEIGEVAANVGTTPAAWNAGVFSMIRTLSDNVVVPIAGMILTFVLCYELITMIIDRNNLHDFETFIFYKWIVKAFVAVMLVTHTFDITMAIFDVAQHIVQQSAGIISSSTSLDFAAVLGNVSTQLEAMEIGELLGLVVETMMLRVTAPIPYHDGRYCHHRPGGRILAAGAAAGRSGHRHIAHVRSVHQSDGLDAQLLRGR